MNNRADVCVAPGCGVLNGVSGIPGDLPEYATLPSHAGLCGGGLTLSLATRGIKMENVYYKEVEEKDVAVKETRIEKENVGLEETKAEHQSLETKEVFQDQSRPNKNSNLEERSTKPFEDEGNKESFKELETEKSTLEYFVGQFSKKEDNILGYSESLKVNTISQRKCRPSLKKRLFKKRLAEEGLISEMSSSKGVNLTEESVSLGMRHDDTILMRMVQPCTQAENSSNNKGSNVTNLDKNEKFKPWPEISYLESIRKEKDPKIISGELSLTTGNQLITNSSPTGSTENVDNTKENTLGHSESLKLMPVSQKKCRLSLRRRLSKKNRSTLEVELLSLNKGLSSPGDSESLALSQDDTILLKVEQPVIAENFSENKDSNVASLDNKLLTNSGSSGIIKNTDISVIGENPSGINESLNKIVSRVGESLENSLKTTQDKQESGAIQSTSFKKKKKKKKRKKKTNLDNPNGEVTSMEGGSSNSKIAQSGNQKVNGKQKGPSKTTANKSKKKKRLVKTPGFSFVNMIGSIIRNQSNIVQGSLLGLPAIMPLIQRNLVENARHLLQNQTLLGNPVISSLIQRNLPVNQGAPLTNQKSSLKHRAIPPLIQVNTLRNLENLPRYEENLRGLIKDHHHENIGNQPRNLSSLLNNEANPLNNEIKSENLHRTQSNQRNPRIQGNQSGSQNNPSRYQEYLLVQPSTSRSDVKSTDSPYSGECSSISRKRRGSSDSPTPDDSKRTKSSKSESPRLDNDLTKLIIAKDFGKLKLSNQELMLIRIAISQEIDKIPNGRIPRFNDTFMKAYGIIVECADNWSRDWLTDRIRKIYPWTGARLRVVDLPTTEKFYEAVLFIPGIIEEPDIILKRLEKQNPPLKTSNWKICSLTEKCNPQGLHLILGIPYFSIQILQEMNFEPFLGMSRIKITLTLAEN